MSPIPFCAADQCRPIALDVCYFHLYGSGIGKLMFFHLIFYVLLQDHAWPSDASLTKQQGTVLWSNVHVKISQALRECHQN